MAVPTTARRFPTARHSHPPATLLALVAPTAAFVPATTRPRTRCVTIVGRVVGHAAGAGGTAAPPSPQILMEGVSEHDGAHVAGSMATDTPCVVPTAAHGAGTSLPKIGPSLAPQLAAHDETDLRGDGGSEIRLISEIRLLSLLPLAVTGCCSQKAGGGGGAVFGMEGAEDAQPCFGRAGGFLRCLLRDSFRSVAQPISQPISEGSADGGAGTSCEKA